MITASAIADTLSELGFTHVVWLPDSALGPWESELQRRFALVRVCREGEAWAIAAGLHIGGAKPLVMIQCTGLFESGDALRNALFDLGLPLFAVVGYRSYLLAESTDTARRFTEPVLDAWGLEWVVVKDNFDLRVLVEHVRRCAEHGKPGVALVAEGRM